MTLLGVTMSNPFNDSMAVGPYNDSTALSTDYSGTTQLALQLAVRPLCILLTAVVTSQLRRNCTELGSTDDELCVRILFD